MAENSVAVIFGSAAINRGASVACAVVADGLSDVDRLVLLDWSERASERGQTLLVRPPCSVTIPAGQPGTVFILATNPRSHGEVMVHPRIGGGEDGTRLLAARPASLHIYDAQEIPISLTPVDDSGGSSVPPLPDPNTNGSWGASTIIRADVRCTNPNDISLSLQRHISVQYSTKVLPAGNARLIAVTVQPDQIYMPNDPFLAENDDYNFFKFSLPGGLPSGTYIVTVVVTISVNTSQTAYSGRATQSVPFLVT